MEIDEIVVKESPGLCRCCLSEGCYKDLGSEYTWMNGTEIYADMLLDCFDISITQHNEGPNGPNRLICEVCITRLRDACNFKKQVLDSEKKFIDMIGRGEFRPKMVIYEAHMKSEENAPSDDGEVEYLEEDMEFVEDGLIKDESTAEPTVSDITVSALPLRGKRGRPKKTITPVKPEKKLKVAKIEEKPKTSKAVAKGEYQGSNEATNAERRRKNLEILFNNTTVMPFKWRNRYRCFFCRESYDDYLELKEHTQSHGPCSTKDYSLINTKSLSDIKIDVSEIGCIICNEPFHKFEEIIDHLITNHNLDYDKIIDIPFQEFRLVDFRCLNCDQQFSYYRHLVKHMNDFHPQNSFVCEECGVTVKKGEMSCHVRNYHKEGGYPCDFCTKNLESIFSLHKHQKKTDCGLCFNCGIKFTSPGLLHLHILAKHPSDGSLKCSYCSKQFNTNFGLKQHILNKCKIKTSIQKYSNSNLPDSKNGNRKNVIVLDPLPITWQKKWCNNDNQENVENFNIQENIIVDEGDPKDDISCNNNSDPRSVKVRCARLPLSVPKRKPVMLSHRQRRRITIQLRQNILTVLNMSTIVPFKFFSIFTCFYCTKKSSDFEEIREHTNSQHPTSITKPACNLNSKCIRSYKGSQNAIKVDVSELACKVCQLPMDDLDSLIDHIISEHNANYDKSIKRPFAPFMMIQDNIPCPVCPDRTFRYFILLLRHLNAEHSNNRRICDLCGRSFQQSSNFLMHMAMAHGSACECDICGTTFKNQPCLDRHKAKEHDFKGYKCPKCPEMFKSQYDKRKHLIEAHDIGHKCSYCGKMFTRNSFMNDHVRRMHLKEKSKQCSICGSRFFSGHYLKLHMKNHNGERNFGCDACGKTFFTKYHLKRHLNIHKDDREV